MEFIQEFTAACESASTGSLNDVMSSMKAEIRAEAEKAGVRISFSKPPKGIAPKESPIAVAGSQPETAQKASAIFKKVASKYSPEIKKLNPNFGLKVSGNVGGVYLLMVNSRSGRPAQESNLEGASEGLIQKFKNRRIPKNFWKENKVQANASSVKDAIDKFIASDTGSDYMDTFVVKVNDVVVGFRGDRKSQYQNDPELVRATERAIGQTSAVYKALVDSIVKDHNDSKGVNGPWGWQDRDRDENGNINFKPTTASEVRANVRLNYIEADGKGNDGVPYIVWWFDDGPHEIYGAHSLCVYTRDCFDAKGNFIKSKFDSTLEG